MCISSFASLELSKRGKERSNLNKLRLMRNRLKGKSTFALTTMLSIVVLSSLVWNCQFAFHAQAFSIDLPSMTLTVVAPDGTQITLNEIDIGNMLSYRAYGGYRNTLGVIKGFGTYTGVPITSVCDTVGGILSGYSVSIIGVDGYSKKMSYEELNGALKTYDNVTGEEVQHNETLTAVLAYYYNDVNVSSTDGPLRVAIVGPEGLCTSSTFWVKQVVRLEVHANLQPMNLTLVASDGTQTVLNETAISLLTAIRGVGASRNQLGIVKNLGNYTGPSLNTLCDLVGGMNANTTLRITALDNYSVTLTYAEFNGALTTYDPLTGEPVQHNETLTLILAYHFNDNNLSLSDGTLKLAIISPENLATSSSYWVKNVVKLEILRILVGDLNSDQKVDIFDALVLANSFGTTPADPPWNSKADLNADNIIDIFDAILLGKHFGE
jgi:hypothetical protein